MARPLISLPRWPGRRALLISLLLVLLLHALALLVFQRLLQPPSILKEMGATFYTRTLTPEAPAGAVAAAATEAPAAPRRPSAQFRKAPTPTPKKTPKSPKAAPADVASAPQAAASSALAESAPEPDATPQAQLGPDSPASTVGTQAPESPASAAASSPDTPEPSAVAAASAPANAASDPDPAYLASWPRDTRLNYKLGGNYRGELHGDARVLWQRVGARYHASVEVGMGLLGSLSFSSQGDITPAGLRPEVYEENLRGRRRGVRLGEDVRLNNGERVARPPAAQDTASQFVELGHRFATGQVQLAPGTQIRFALARPGGIDDWVFDVVGQETIDLPQLGPVQTWHLKPRRLDKPRGPISAEMWFAPTLQYLPVRIRITQSEDTYLDLVVETIQQK